jgi:hypothetical protein
VKFNRTNMFSTCLGVAGKNFESSKHVDLEIITNEIFFPKVSGASPQGSGTLYSECDK